RLRRDPRTLSLRAVRPDPALRIALWLLAAGSAGRWACRHGSGRNTNELVGRDRYRVRFRRRNSAGPDFGRWACRRAVSRTGNPAAHDASRDDVRLQLGCRGAPVHRDLPRAAPRPCAPGRAAYLRYTPRIVPSATPASVDVIF